jgi:hypothetical protein
MCPVVLRHPGSSRTSPGSRNAVSQARGRPHAPRQDSQPIGGSPTPRPGSGPGSVPQPIGGAPAQGRTHPSWVVRKHLSGPPGPCPRATRGRTPTRCPSPLACPASPTAGRRPAPHPPRPNNAVERTGHPRARLPGRSPRALASWKNSQQVEGQGQEAAHRGHRSTQEGSPGGPHVNRSTRRQAETRPPEATGLQAGTAFTPASRKAGTASTVCPPGQPSPRPHHGAP